VSADRHDPRNARLTPTVDPRPPRSLDDRCSAVGGERVARAAIVESQSHWGAVLALTGDTRSQRRQRELLALIDAMLKTVESLPERGLSEVSRQPG